MTKYLEFKIEAEAEAFALKMGQAKGYMDVNGDPTAFGLSVKTYRYAKPVLHPKAKALLFKAERAVCAVDKNGAYVSSNQSVCGCVCENEGAQQKKRNVKRQE